MKNISSEVRISVRLRFYFKFNGVGEHSERKRLCPQAASFSNGIRKRALMGGETVCDMGGINEEERAKCTWVCTGGSPLRQVTQHRMI